MSRLARAGIAVVLLLAFFADLRVIAPALAVLLALAGWRGVLPRGEAGVGAVLLAGATLAFQADAEVVAWTLALAVASLAGFEAASATGRPGRARRAVGSSNRGR